MSRYDEQTSTLRRPNCFGDPREHDERDSTCRKCKWESTCGVIVKNKLRDARDSRDERDDRRRYDRVDDRRRDDRDRRGPGSSIPVNPDPESFVEREDESLGFFGALAFNSMLSGFRAGMVEGIFALDQIPRAPYQDPFKKMMAPRRPRDDDEEEDE